jgi:sugar fermentation stimulation protein A
MSFGRPVLEGELVRRYKRFLADVKLGGKLVTVHVPNSGSMLGVNVPGSSVLVSDSENPARKLRHTLEAVKIGRTWVGVNTAHPNAFVRRLLEQRHLAPFAKYSEVKPEFVISKTSRLDFRLQGPRLPDLYVEVKNVSLAADKVALFPDSVTERGAKHMRELAELVGQGHRAAVIFFVQRADCMAFSTASDIDPAYSLALAQAVGAGVEVVPLSIGVSAKGVRLRGILPYVGGAMGR